MFEDEESTRSLTTRFQARVQGIAADSTKSIEHRQLERQWSTETLSWGFESQGTLTPSLFFILAPEIDHGHIHPSADFQYTPDGKTGAQRGPVQPPIRIPS